MRDHHGGRHLLGPSHVPLQSGKHVGRRVRVEHDSEDLRDVAEIRGPEGARPRFFWQSRHSLETCRSDGSHVDKGGYNSDEGALGYGVDRANEHEPDANAHGNHGAMSARHCLRPIMQICADDDKVHAALSDLEEDRQRNNNPLALYSKTDFGDVANAPRCTLLSPDLGHGVQCAVHEQRGAARGAARKRQHQRSSDPAAVGHHSGQAQDAGTDHASDQIRCGRERGHSALRPATRLRALDTIYTILTRTDLGIFLSTLAGSLDQLTGLLV
mmetsp:Transcript_123182/g.394562  ORF Transcript_123182/g.394562 Transcript_123182/m.394562 type:complete len:271 (-) Transcript_123182:284-1096(-)